MTRKDFELIAAVLKRARQNEDAGGHAVINGLAVNLAEALATTNPRFDRDRFIRATFDLHQKEGA